jgi:hypothetical protein
VTFLFDKDNWFTASDNPSFLIVLGGSGFRANVSLYNVLALIFIHTLYPQDKMTSPVHSLIKMLKSMLLEEPEDLMDNYEDFASVVTDLRDYS